MLNETHYFISGMKCEGCVANAKAAIEKIEGIEKVDVDLSLGEASVVGDVDPQAVCLALTEAGYPAVVKSR